MQVFLLELDINSQMPHQQNHKNEVRAKWLETLVGVMLTLVSIHIEIREQL